MTVPRILLLAVAVSASLTSPAHAYLDPGTGSMLLSAIIGVVAAAGLGLKMFWYRLIGLVRSKRGGSRPDPVGGPPATNG
jgi:hypothetical protein